MTSSARRPARSPAPPSETESIRAPTLPSGSNVPICSTVMPSRGSGGISPSFRSWFTTRRMAWVGMAKPSPSMLENSDIILMVLMPTTWPYWLMRGPPELPEFRAALVWIRVMVRPSTSTSRSRAETRPSVKVPRSSTPRGLPMA